MGMIAKRYADHLIITSDNPRSEKPEMICQDIIARLTTKPIIEIDRRSAIEKGLAIARKNDIVLIAGKGHEPFQNIKGRLLSFDDRKVAQIASSLTVQSRCKSLYV